jgi:two-component system, NarL family, nitrate/nitrite response regulator NarL
MKTKEAELYPPAGNPVTADLSAGSRGGSERVPLTDARVVLVMSNTVVRQGMRTLLRELPLGSLHSCRTLQEADFTGMTHPARSVVIVADAEWAQMPPSEIPPAVKTLILLATPSGVDSLADYSRADGFLLQSELGITPLSDALVRVLSDQFPIPPAVARRLVANGPLQRTGPARVAQLTDRQHTTLRLLSEGLTNREISRRLNISEHGAKRLVGTVLTKLGSANRAGAVAIGVREGLLP